MPDYALRISVDGRPSETGGRQVTRSLQQIREAARGAASAIDSMGPRVGRSLETIRKEAGATRESVTALEKALHSLEGKRWFDALMAASEKIQKRFENLRKVIDGMRDVGTTLTKWLTLPVLGLGLAAFKVGADMDALRRGLESQAGSAKLAAIEWDRLREVSKLPGLGFEEAVRGSVRLQSVGFSAKTAERALREVGNAVALAGGGREELDRATTQLQQMANAGRVLAADLKPLRDAAPGISKAMEAAFGTANPEQINKMKIPTEQFFSRLFDAMEKLPRVSGGAKNSLENFTDSVKQSLTAISYSSLPSVAAGLDFVAASIGLAADKWNAFSPGSRKAVIGLAAIAAGAGPVINALAGISGAILSLVSKLKLLTSAEGLAALVGMITPQGLLMAGLAAVAAGFAYAGYRAVQASVDARRAADEFRASLATMNDAAIKTQFDVIGAQRAQGGVLIAAQERLIAQREGQFKQRMVTQQLEHGISRQVYRDEDQHWLDAATRVLGRMRAEDDRLRERMNVSARELTDRQALANATKDHFGGGGQDSGASKVNQRAAAWDRVREAADRAGKLEEFHLNRLDAETNRIVNPISEEFGRLFDAWKRAESVVNQMNADMRLLGTAVPVGAAEALAQAMREAAAAAAAFNNYLPYNLAPPTQRSYDAVADVLRGHAFRDRPKGGRVTEGGDYAGFDQSMAKLSAETGNVAKHLTTIAGKVGAVRELAEAANLAGGAFGGLLNGVDGILGATKGFGKQGLKGIGDFFKGGLSGTLSNLTTQAGLGLVSGISSLVGGAVSIIGSLTRGDVEGREIRRQNNVALDRLTAALYKTTDSLTGKLTSIDALGAISEAFAGSSRAGRPEAGNAAGDYIRSILKQYGLSMGDILSLADSQGIQLFDSKGRFVTSAFGQLVDAIQITIDNLTKWGNTLDEVRARQDLQARVSNLLSGREEQPVDALARELALLKSRAPNLSAAFGLESIDVNSAAGRTALMEAIQRLLGTDKFTPEQLGHLAGVSDLQGILGNLVGGLEKFRDAIDATTQQFNNPLGFKRIAQLVYDAAPNNFDPFGLGGASPAFTAPITPPDELARDVRRTMAATQAAASPAPITFTYAPQRTIQVDGSNLSAAELRRVIDDALESYEAGEKVRMRRLFEEVAARSGNPAATEIANSIPAA